MKECFDSNNTLGSSSKSAKKAKAAKAQKSKKEPDALAKIGGKDLNLDLFHALGKVLYAKRTEETEKFENVPKEKLRNTLKSTPEEIVENLPTSAENFNLFLHQHSPTFFTRMEDFAEAAECLSVSDPFYNEWTVIKFEKKEIQAMQILPISDFRQNLTERLRIPHLDPRLELPQSNGRQKSWPSEVPQVRVVRCEPNVEKEVR